MKLIYNPIDGKIFEAVLDKDTITFQHSINIPVEEFVIDEIPENKSVITDLHKIVKRVDSNGLGKYYIQNGELHLRDGWEQATE